MNTSSRPSRQKTSKNIGSFSYPEAGVGGTSASGPWIKDKEKDDDRQLRESAALEAGRREGEAQARAAFASQMDQLRVSLTAAVEEFARERRDYFVRVERELVQLSLSIARKVLHRESNIDPVLLAGMVRVLLEKINQRTKVTVRVHPLQVSDFRMFFARHMSENPPDIVEDPALEFDRCTVHTELGTTEVGPEVQLKEIEQALLDLKSTKPKSE